MALHPAQQSNFTWLKTHLAPLTRRGSLLPEQSGEHSRQSRLTHIRNTRIALYPMGELVAASRTHEPDLLKRWLCGGVQDLGEPVLEEFLLDWLAGLMTLDVRENKYCKS